ncbi:hypothetical protein [Lentibacillus sp. JNUCC-1]|uniref:hypothetical protein n=1 Tax=Lentibacillus sp. JNUCC-1 TaxID=2654513 RepID=UPI001E377E25|nr:hypothetical protein [Lentibacillus sp. JNUCC-1]
MIGLIHSVSPGSCFVTQVYETSDYFAPYDSYHLENTVFMLYLDMKVKLAMFDLDRWLKGMVNQIVDERRSNRSA